MSEGIACYSCTNCGDPFNSLYIQVVYYNDTAGYQCYVSYFFDILMKKKDFRLENIDVIADITRRDPVVLIFQYWSYYSMVLFNESLQRSKEKSLNHCFEFFCTYFAIEQFILKGNFDVLHIGRRFLCLEGLALKTS